MIVVPIYALASVPVLIVWWTHRRCERREHTLLTVSFLFSFALLLIPASHGDPIATHYDGPSRAKGIVAGQVLATLISCTLIAAIPTRLRLLKMLRNLLAILIGEYLILAPAWIS